MLANFRDVSIILLALESIVIGVILLLLLWQVRLLVLLLRDEIGPILRDTQETTKTVQSTTRFVGKRVAKPAVSTISFVAGIKGAIRAMKADIAPSSPLQDAASATAVKTDVVGNPPLAAPTPTAPPPAPKSSLNE